MERRRNRRTDSLKGARVSWERDTMGKTSHILDLSVGGVFIETPAPLPVGQTIAMMLEMPGNAMRVKGIVQRLEAGRGMGLEFVELEDANRERLVQLVQAAPRQTQQDSPDSGVDVSHPPEEQSTATSPAGIVLPPAAKPSPALVPSSSERRAEIRLIIPATAEITEAGSLQTFAGVIANVAQSGCYVKTDRIVQPGAELRVHVRKGVFSCAAQARVVHASAGKGLGLEFTAIDPKDLEALNRWLKASRETAWLNEGRRRNQRLTLAVPVLVEVQDHVGEWETERTQTASVSPHGASVLLAREVEMGQKLILYNPQTGFRTECSVAHRGNKQGERWTIGLAFCMPNRDFWRVAFPPSDWSASHPEAKKRTLTGVKDLIPTAVQD